MLSEASIEVRLLRLLDEIHALVNSWPKAWMHGSAFSKKEVPNAPLALKIDKQSLEQFDELDAKIERLTSHLKMKLQPASLPSDMSRYQIHGATQLVRWEEGWVRDPEGWNRRILWLRKVVLEDVDLKTQLEVSEDNRPPQENAKKPVAKRKPKRKWNKSSYEKEQTEATIAADWKQARDARESKADFAKRINKTPVELDRLLDRVYQRNRLRD